MILSEGNIIAHQYFFIAGLVLFVLFLIYVYGYDHQTTIKNNTIWKDVFVAVGIPEKNIDDISHDDDMWYYKGSSTCVAYGGDFSKKCPKYESYCPGGDTYGDAFLQALEVKKAIDNGGEHPLCPLIYHGTD